MFGRIARCLGGAIALLVALGACSEAEGNQEEEIVAVVKGEPIAAQELQRALRAEARVAAQALEDPAWRERRKRQLLDELIDRKLLEQAAIEHGIRLEEGEIDKAVLRLRAEYPGEAYEELLDEQRLSAADLRDRLRRQLLVEQLLAREVYARVAVTDAEVEAWLEENPEFLRSRPERVRASQIVVKTEEEAKKIREELRKGAPFAELASRHSLSPDARVGGDLGWFARGEMPPAFEEVCFGLAPGRVSGVVESAYGFHIFLVQERERGAEVDEGERMREAEARLLHEKTLEAQASFLARLRENATVSVNEKVLARVGEKR